MGDRGCNFECVKKKDLGGDDTVEFIGPVKIILVDQPKSVYRRKVISAAFIVLAQMLMATTVITVLFFSMSYKKKYVINALHILLSTVGLQLFMPSGILSVNILSGSSQAMKPAHRKFEHIFLQSFGLAFAIIGGIATYFCHFSPYFTIHSIFGIFAIIVAVVSALVGIFYKDDQDDSNVLNNFHRYSGVFAFTLSAVCMVSGLIKTPFIKWLPSQDMCYFLIIFCFIYTSVIIFSI